MDLDGDGVKDIITGSYTGDTYFFRNEGHGKYAKAQIIKSKSGENLRYGGMSTTGAGDWNGDGKVDLIIQGGNKFVFVPGTGKLAFGDPVPILIGGKQLELHDGVAHAVDWNQDGKLDIVTGDFDGRIAYYPLIGVEQGVPQFGEAVTLVEALPKEEKNYIFEFEYENQKKHLLKNGRSGNRAKVTVADWNDDGKLDLLVGDLLVCKAPERMLTQADLEQKKQLEKQRAEAQEKFDEYNKYLEAKTYEALGVTDPTKMTKEQRDLAMKRFQDSEYKRLLTCLVELGMQVGRYIDPPRRYGFVWVYLQK